MSVHPATRPPRIPDDLWADTCAAAAARGLSPVVLLVWLLRHALDSLPRIEVAAAVSDEEIRR